VTHLVKGGESPDLGQLPRGTQERFARWTKARTGKGAEMTLLTKGAMKKPHPKRRMIKRK
jgi:hypothetical protein